MTVSTHVYPYNSFHIHIFQTQKPEERISEHAYQLFSEVCNGAKPHFLDIQLYSSASKASKFESISL